MQCFELTLKGFNGSGDKTDELIKWVKAPSREVLDWFLFKFELTTLLQEPPNEMLGIARDFDLADGVDVILGENGAIVGGNKHPDEWKKLVDEIAGLQGELLIVVRDKDTIDKVVKLVGQEPDDVTPIGEGIDLLFHMPHGEIEKLLPALDAASLVAHYELCLTGEE